DLHLFDVAFGLPDPVFSKVNQNGGSNLPAPDSSWSVETSLDVEWAHAVAPGANILLVEGNNPTVSSLFNAVIYAAAQPNVVVVSMSWGSGEFSTELGMDSTFTTPAGHAGVAFVSSTGDNGAPPSYPATSPNVLAVGGTSLYLTGQNAWSNENA